MSEIRKITYKLQLSERRKAYRVQLILMGKRYSLSPSFIKEICTRMKEYEAKGYNPIDLVETVDSQIERQEK